MRAGGGGGGCRLRELKGVREYSKQQAGRKSKFKLAVGTPTENTGVRSWGNPDSDAVCRIYVRFSVDSCRRSHGGCIPGRALTVG